MSSLTSISGRCSVAAAVSHFARPLPLVLLVTAALFSNYIDRGNLATSAPLMQDALHLRAA